MRFKRHLSLPTNIIQFISTEWAVEASCFSRQWEAEFAWFPARKAGKIPPTISELAAGASESCRENKMSRTALYFVNNFLYFFGNPLTA